MAGCVRKANKAVWGVFLLEEEHVYFERVNQQKTKNGQKNKCCSSLSHTLSETERDTDAHTDTKKKPYFPFLTWGTNYISFLKLLLECASEIVYVSKRGIIALGWSQNVISRRLLPPCLNTFAPFSEKTLYCKIMQYICKNIHSPTRLKTLPCQ